jgi:hypothetical protein
MTADHPGVAGSAARASLKGLRRFPEEGRRPVTLRRSEVILWGRPFEKYRRMFALTDENLAERILGCGDGPARGSPAPTRSEAGSLGR